MFFHCSLALPSPLFFSSLPFASVPLSSRVCVVDASEPGLKPNEKPSVALSDDEERQELKLAATPLERAARELPVARYRPEIVNTIKSFPVTIIQGALLTNPPRLSPLDFSRALHLREAVRGCCASCSVHAMNASVASPLYY